MSVYSSCMTVVEQRRCLWIYPVADRRRAKVITTVGMAMSVIELGLDYKRQLVLSIEISVYQQNSVDN